MYPGTAEPFRISPAKPAAYSMELNNDAEDQAIDGDELDDFDSVPDPDPDPDFDSDLDSDLEEDPEEPRQSVAGGA